MRSILLCLLLAPTANAALVTYEYRGAEYDYFRTEGDSEGLYEFWNPWLESSQTYVTGRLTIDTDYLQGGTIANQSFFVQPSRFVQGCTTPGCSETAIHDWEFFDGFYRSNITDMDWVFMAEHLFTLATDAAGNLIAWDIILSGDPDAMWLNSRRGDERGQGSCMDMATSDTFRCVKSSQAGTWTKVPEPSALLLMLAALGLVRRTRVGGRRVAA